MDIKLGDKVEYKWGDNTICGSVAEIVTGRVTRTFDWSRTTRIGTKRNPVLYINNDSYQVALKCLNEVTKV